MTNLILAAAFQILGNYKVISASCTDTYHPPLNKPCNYSRVVITDKGSFKGLTLDLQGSTGTSIYGLGDGTSNCEIPGSKEGLCVEKNGYLGSLTFQSERFVMEKTITGFTLSHSDEYSDFVGNQWGSSDLLILEKE